MLPEFALFGPSVPTPQFGLEWAVFLGSEQDTLFHGHRHRIRQIELVNPELAAGLKRSATSSPVAFAFSDKWNQIEALQASQHTEISSA
jgi:hypothetical protein